MKHIYTKTGDKGETSLRDGVRVPKDDSRIETNGQLDQLNALLGVIRSMLKDDDANKDMIHKIQLELMTRNYSCDDESSVRLSVRIS